MGAATAWRAWRPLRMQARDLPIYTIIVALYDEATAVPGLIAALRCLDYPAEKLQIILVLEPDDVATQSALAKLELGPPFEVLIAPDRGPRTKPKALNAALALARGSFTAVFDAEDRPAPDQLHRALDAFLGNGPEIACVQARLTIDNTSDSLAGRNFHRRICRPLRRAAAGTFRAPPAAAAWRVVEPFRHRGFARDRRRVGPVQRDRRRRSRDAARAPRLSRRRDRLHHLRGSARAPCAPGSASAPAGSKAGCRRGSCICAIRCGWRASFAPAASSRSSLWSAARCCPRWCIRCLLAWLSVFGADRRAASGRGRCHGYPARHVMDRRAHRRLSDVGHARTDRAEAARACCGTAGCCC